MQCRNAYRMYITMYLYLYLYLMHIYIYIYMYMYIYTHTTYINGVGDFKGA